MLEAEEFGEIEPWDFFYPKRAVIHKGVLEYLEFPDNKFYFKVIQGKELIFFVGEEQPTEGVGSMLRGRKSITWLRLFWM